MEKAITLVLEDDFNGHGMILVKLDIISLFSP